jgi:RNA polymerase sigma-70 factor (ECF subfamily)
MDGYPLSLASSSELGERLLLLWERTGDDWLRQLAEAMGADSGIDDLGELGARPREELVDWISTALMNAYKKTGDTQAFALLFELNRLPFMHAIQSRTRRGGGRVDPNDVLQEVFLNIYRYPHRFKAEKADSFRNWGHRIVRNTLLKFLKSHNRLARFGSIDEEIGEREDARMRSPFRCAQDAETAGIVDQAYLIYLSLYLVHFQRLSAKERRALTMVEVEGASYRDAARELGIRLENLKMVIFRGRRKIFRGLQRTLEDLTAHSLDTTP